MTIKNVSPSTLQLLKERLMSDHQTAVTAPLTPDGAGQIQGHGVIANYTYNQAAQELEIEVLHHPFYVPLHAIEGSISETVDAVRPVAVTQAQEA